MGFSFVAKHGKDLEHLAFKGVMRADDANPSREVSDGGSVLRVPSTRFRTTG
jgi:hypothetical protein